MRGRGKSIRTGDFFSRPRASHLNDAIPFVDLHGLRHHIGEARVKHFMREQLVKGTPAVKIIHGNGQGVMRQVAYDWIRTNRARVWKTEDVGPAVIVYLTRT